jgi:hypothetical protein
MRSAFSFYPPCSNGSVLGASKVEANATFPEVSKAEESMTQCFLQPFLLRIAKTALSYTECDARPL